MGRQVHEGGLFRMRYSGVTSRQGQLHLDESSTTADMMDISMAIAPGQDLPSILKQATHQSHRDIEKNPVLKRLFSKNFRLTDYLLILEKMYGYYVPIEKSLENYIHSHQTHGFNYSNKSGLLAQDLMACGLNGNDIDGLALANNTLEIDSLEAFVGCIYVLEGSTMGGQVISKHLIRLFGPDVQKRLAFYQCYGGKVMQQWQQTRNWIEEIGNNNEINANLAADCAITMFDSMNDWFSL